MNIDLRSKPNELLKNKLNENQKCVNNANKSFLCKEKICKLNNEVEIDINGLQEQLNRNIDINGIENEIEIQKNIEKQNQLKQLYGEYQRKKIAEQLKLYELNKKIEQKKKEENRIINLFKDSYFIAFLTFIIVCIVCWLFKIGYVPKSGNNLKDRIINFNWAYPLAIALLIWVLWHFCLFPDESRMNAH